MKGIMKHVRADLACLATGCMQHPYLLMPLVLSKDNKNIFPNWFVFNV